MAALGAGRSRLLRDAAIESAMLAVVGGALGVWLAGGLLRCDPWPGSGQPVDAVQRDRRPESTRGGVRDHSSRSPRACCSACCRPRERRGSIRLTRLKQQSRSSGQRRRVVARRARVHADRARRRSARRRGIVAAQLREVEPGRSRLSEPTAWSCSISRCRRSIARAARRARSCGTWSSAWNPRSARPRRSCRRLPSGGAATSDVRPEAEGLPAPHQIDLTAVVPRHPRTSSRCSASRCSKAGRSFRKTARTRSSSTTSWRDGISATPRRLDGDSRPTPRSRG